MRGWKAYDQLYSQSSQLVQGSLTSEPLCTEGVKFTLVRVFICATAETWEDDKGSVRIKSQNNMMARWKKI
ncbi:uncharacterized [Tachysurus ichikawai]